MRELCSWEHRFPMSKNLNPNEYSTIFILENFVLHPSAMNKWNCFTQLAQTPPFITFKCKIASKEKKSDFMLNRKLVTFRDPNKCEHAQRCVLLTVFKYSVPSFDSKSFCSLKRGKRLSTLLVCEKKIAELFNLILYSNLFKIHWRFFFFFSQLVIPWVTEQNLLFVLLWLIRLYLAGENEHWLLLCTVFIAHFPCSAPCTHRPCVTQSIMMKMDAVRINAIHTQRSPQMRCAFLNWAVN